MVGAGSMARPARPPGRQGKARGPGAALGAEGVAYALRRTGASSRPIRPGPPPGARRPPAPGAAPSRTTSASSRSRSQRVSRSKVLKMLAAMEQTPNTSRDPVEDFLTTGRTGRRNAMADILGQHASTGSGDLSERMEGLTTEQMAAAPSTSAAAAAGQPGATAPGATASSDAGPSKEAGR